MSQIGYPPDHPVRAGSDTKIRLAKSNGTFGPYNASRNRHTFSKLDTDAGQNLKCIVVASGMIQIGQFIYEFQSEVAEYSWIRPTSTITSIATDARTPTPTYRPTNTATNTPTATATSTPTDTPTFTPTYTPTDTPTNTPSATATSTPTNTPTRLPDDSEQLGGLILAPANLSFSYDVESDVGTVMWEESNRIDRVTYEGGPIQYELRIVLPDRVEGIVRVAENSRSLAIHGKCRKPGCQVYRKGCWRGDYWPSYIRSDV